ncbi:hypothetical protein [Pontibacter ummariensis]|nr:hypothetical protein [Pontibacter ummariensis]
MKRLVYTLFFLIALSLASVSCGQQEVEEADEAEGPDIPVSAEHPRAPTVAPTRPDTDMDPDVQDSLEVREGEEAPVME